MILTEELARRMMDNNMPNKLITKSNCCNAEIKVITDEDLGRAGTSYYECSKCCNPCDPQPTTNNLERWEESFGKQFNGIINSSFECCDAEKLFSDVKQFISDLRKHDMVELIKMLRNKPNKDDISFDLCSHEVKRLIKDYYNK